ncbi:MAG TPA: Mut7-C RNAse domain-containing protein [Nitrososphaerales archaeon]|nr:Mut7-C RNAse domain-containing protein [Nitrososphaerales archaeon]
MPPDDERRAHFIADAMLGSLCRKLRALGFDTAYYKAGNDSGIITMASAQKRIILTSDRSLAAIAMSKGLLAILVEGKNDGERISAISRAAAASGTRLVRGDPLCSICGGELFTLRRVEVLGEVPPSVAVSHRLFYRCGSCGKYYWRGSHWKKLRSLSRRLGSK